MVLESIVNVKRISSILTFSVLSFIFGNIIPITNLYSKYIVKSHDDENTLVAIVVMVEWPIYLLAGGVLGNFIYKKYLSKKINSDS